MTALGLTKKPSPVENPDYWFGRPTGSHPSVVRGAGEGDPYALAPAERSVGVRSPGELVPNYGRLTQIDKDHAAYVSRLQPGTITQLPDGSYLHRGVPIDYKTWAGTEQYDWDKEFPDGLPAYIGPMPIQDLPPGYRNPTAIKELLRSQRPAPGPRLFGEPGQYPPSIFGKPPGVNPDLFGKPYGVPPDMFGKPYGVEPDLFGRPPYEPITLFGKPTTVQPDLFGKPSTLPPRLCFEDPV
ncbi:hypothetical protein K525DRAFT_219388 [Schizophyllum commune Loenen D]|nr:hypothetical protein K525DRAFT_219388 [Schizophyllum commune Loenen D]